MSDLKGILLDLNDFDGIEFDIPASVQRRINIETESVVNSRRNAVLRWWDSTGETVTLNLDFHRRTNGIFDVYQKIKWLEERAYPRYLGDLIARPPTRFAISLGGSILPDTAEWEIQDGIDIDTSGYLSQIEGFIPPIAKVRITFIRVDDTAGVAGF